MEEREEETDLVEPVLGGPELLVLLVDGVERAIREIAGGFWEFVVGLGFEVLGMQFSGVWRKRKRRVTVAIVIDANDRLFGRI